MKGKGIILALMAFILALSATIHAQDEQPKIPFIQRNVCPFECCQFGKWTAESALKAYKKPNDKSVIVFTIAPGEEFIALSGNVHILKFGKLILEKSFENFTKGDSVYILAPRGEGAYYLWYKGKTLDLGLDNLGAIWSNSTFINPPAFVWWVYVKNKDGQQGWLRLNNIAVDGFLTEEQFDGADSCS